MNRVYLLIMLSVLLLVVGCKSASAVVKEPLRKALKHIGAEVIYDYNIINGMAIRKPESMTLDATISVLRQVEGVTSVERDRITRLTDPVRPRLLER